MSEHVSIAEELRARIEELTRERDGLKHREDLLKIANEQLLHVNKSVARHGIITESVRRLTELLGIDDDATKPTANETTDAAAEAIERLTRERDGARESVVDTLLERERLRESSARYKRERDEALAELDFIRAEYGRCENEKLAEDALAMKIAVLTQELDEAQEKVQSRGRKAISPQELNAVVAALHDALLSTPRPNTDALRPRLGWPRRKTYAVVREAVRLGMIERVGVYRWTWFRMPFCRSDKP